MNFKNTFVQNIKTPSVSFMFKVIQVFSFFTLAFVVFYIDNDFVSTVFSERDISRAGGWLEGRFYWPGPEMSAGSNLPGPFFYFLLFPAFLMGDSVYSQVILWTIIWFALTYTVAFFFVSKIISHRESLLTFLITFILNINTTTHIHNGVLNPEFAVMFHVLALIGLYYWREKRNSLYLYLTGLVIALGIQVHLLVAVHILTVLFFYIIDKSERKKIKALLLFLPLAFSPVLIYNALKYFYVFEISGNNYGSYINSLLKTLFSEGWFKNIKYLVSPSVPFFVLCSAFTLWLKYKTKKWILKPSTKNLLIITAIPFLVAFLGAVISWYLLFIPVLSIILLSKWLDNLLPDKEDKKILFLVGIGLLVINLYLIKWISFSIENKFLLYISFFSVFSIALITILQQHKKNFYKNSLLYLCIFALVQFTVLEIFPKRYRPSKIKQSFQKKWTTNKKLSPLMKQIYLETGWSSKTAMKTILVIGIHPERSLLANYARNVENLNKPLPPPHFLHKEQNTNLKQNYLGSEKVFTKNKAQGYFIIQHLQKFIGWKKEDWRNYLSLSSLLSQILRQEIKEGRTVIQEPKLYDSFWLIPYNTTEASLFPEAFHNVGQPYYWEEPEWLKKCNKTQSFKSEKEELFYCKVLPGHLQKAGLNINFSENFHKESSSLNIQFFGPLLGTIVPNFNIDGSSLWSDIQIHLDCNKNSSYWTLPDIGYHKFDIRLYPEKQAKILLAPLKLRIPLKGCKKDDIKRINLTWTEKHTLRGENKESIIWERD